LKTRLVFDIETDGLLYELTKIHCICAKDLSRGVVYKFRPEEIESGLDLLNSVDYIVGHNISGFDLLAIQKIYPSFSIDNSKVRDTLCMSRLFNPDRPDHSLAGYGTSYNRLKVQHEDWTTFSPEMLHRCSEDVEINCLIYRDLVDRYCRDWNWIEPLLLEQEYSRFVAIQELEGVDFDVDGAYKLLSLLDGEISQLDKILLERIPPVIKPIGNPEGVKPFKKDGSYSEICRKWFSVD
jgi:DNA polymerase I